MSVQGPNRPAVNNVPNPITDVGVGGGAQPASSGTPQQNPAGRDARADAARLNNIAPQQQGFRVGIAGRSIGGVSEAERKLPGGSIAAAYDRAEEYGEIANAAAARVAANHPDIFGA